MSGKKLKKPRATTIDRAYLKAVGKESRPAYRPKEKRPSKETLKKLYVDESFSVRRIAEQLDCSKDLIYRALKEYGIERRYPGEKRSQLKDYELEFLMAEIKKKSHNQVAREMGIHTSTLTRYMKKMKQYE